MTATKDKMIVVRLSPANARLVAQNIDGWVDAGACDGGLNDDERKALNSAYDQITRQLRRHAAIALAGGGK